MLHDPADRRLGKKPPKRPHAMLAEFVDVERILVEAPANVINSATSAMGKPMSIKLAMYLNDREGDCTCAGAGNILRIASNGKLRLTDNQVQDAYVAVTGDEGAAFDPETGDNDNGCVELDVLDYWTKHGIGGDRLLGHAGINANDPEEIRAALYMTGPLYPGWSLATDQQNQKIWMPGKARAGSWGGHCAPICDLWTRIPQGLKIAGVPIPTDGKQPVFNVLTWKQYKACWYSFIGFACDELHALMTKSWLERNQGNPALDTAKLDAYFKTLRKES